ncbi:MAG TPA: hypothetical protein ENI92_03665 [Bacteroidetes bacterium]|nr:hypothetical protein [Bacteroidota bacterium]
MTRAQGRPDLSIAPETLEVLIGYSWPGNIRELRNVLEGGVIKCHEESLRPRHLPLLLFDTKARVGKAAVDRGVESPARKEGTGPSDATPPLTPLFRRALTPGEVAHALQVTEGNVSGAARLLGVSRQHVHRLIKRFGIKPQD